MNMQFFSKYIDDYKKNNKDTIGKIVKVGKSSRGIDYSEALLKWNAIKNFFGLNESAQKLFDQAATGLELGRITQLNSSSLFAFLFFPPVTFSSLGVPPSRDWLLEGHQELDNYGLIYELVGIKLLYYSSETFCVERSNIMLVAVTSGLKLWCTKNRAAVS